MRGARALVAVWVAVFYGCAEAAPSEPLPPLHDLQFDTLFQVGSAAGQPWEKFGGIWDVAAGPDGRFAILDVEAPAVHVFDTSGAHLGSIVEQGLEPGALARPSGITWSRAGELLVLDPGSSWISLFSVTGSGVEYVDRRRAFAFGEIGFCASEDRAYLSYFQEGQVVHQIGHDGGVVNSFAPAPNVVGIETLGPELQEIAVEELTPSGLLCVPGGILDVSFFQSRMQLHDSTGAAIWSRELADFSPVVVYTPDGMGLGRRFDQVDGSHLLRSIVLWGDSTVLVQHAVRTQEVPPAGEVEVFESRLIRLQDGAELDRTRELPLILAGQGTRVYEVSERPFPQVIVLERLGDR